jgi:hypothetical protein
MKIENKQTFNQSFLGSLNATTKQNVIAKNNDRQTENEVNKS